MIRVRARRAAAAVLLVVALAACVPGAAVPGSATPAGSIAPGSASAAVSPVTGQVTAIDAQSLSAVKDFTLRTDAGDVLIFTMGPLDNATQFPPGHLAEHMATGSAVRVFFRDEGGVRVVYRIEDAAAAS